jgi:hypothetical protein
MRQSLLNEAYGISDPNVNRQAANQVKDTLFGLLDVTPVAGAATPAIKAGGKTLAKEAARQIETGTGLLGSSTIDPRTYITAFHGTPHEIAGGKFDLSKIGTGLGAQSFGHGLYFSKSPKFAETFTGRTVIQEPKLDKFTFNGPDYTISNGEYLKNNKPISESEYKDAFKGINNLWNTQNKGNLYKIDIADETIPKMLNWDKPLSEQSPDVLNALEKKFSLESFGKDYATAGDFYKSRRNKFNSNEKASEELKNLGITGINYLDPGSRGTSETLNYVVFDPNTVKILERNGLLLP